MRVGVRSTSPSVASACSGSAREGRRRRRVAEGPAELLLVRPARSRSCSATSERTSEKPFAWSPLDGRPDDRVARPTRPPSISSVRSTTPMQKPARSNSPGSISPGCSAVSPPTRAQPASRQPSATAADELRDAAPGRAGRPRRSRGRRAARRRCRRRRRRTSPRGRGRSCRSGPSAAAIAVFVPTPSVDETRTGSR